jgi:hypothetical protein
MMPTEPNDSELDPLLADAVAELRTAVPARASARAALSTALAAEALPTVAMPRLTVASPAPDALPAKRLRWLTTGRSVRVSPLGLLAAASLLIAGTAAVTSRLGTGATPPPRHRRPRRSCDSRWPRRRHVGSHWSETSMAGTRPPRHYSSRTAPGPWSSRSRLGAISTVSWWMDRPGSRIPTPPGRRTPTSARRIRSCTWGADR